MWDKKGENITYNWLKKLKQVIYEDKREEMLGDPNQVPLKSVQLKCGTTGKIVNTVKFHADFANNLEKAYLEGSTASGYCPKSSGAYNVRKMRGPGINPATAKMSNHSWATAIDFDARKNPYKKGNTSVMQQHPEFIQAFENNGFKWLGDGAGRNSVGDDMHFEINLAEFFPGFAGSAGRSTTKGSAGRLSTKQLSDLKMDQLIKYANSRSQACRNLGYLSAGSTGENATNLQKALIEKGYTIEDPEGEIGESTLASIIKFQIDSGIRTDGCVGPQTAGKLGIKIGQDYNLSKLMTVENFTPSEKTGEVVSGLLKISPDKNVRFVTTPTETRVGGTLAWRNNNPGNLRLKTAWQSYGAIGRAFGFATFETFEDGYRALKTYIDKFGFSSKKHTIASFMRMYAPAQDSNNPSSYAAKIAKSLRASVDDKMSSFKGNEEALEVFAQAIKKVEGTREGKTIKQINTAYFDGASKGNMVA